MGKTALWNSAGILPSLPPKLVKVISDIAVSPVTDSVRFQNLGQGPWLKKQLRISWCFQPSPQSTRICVVFMILIIVTILAFVSQASLQGQRGDIRNHKDLSPFQLESEKKL